MRTPILKGYSSFAARDANYAVLLRHKRTFVSLPPGPSRSVSSQLFSRSIAAICVIFLMGVMRPALAQMPATASAEQGTTPMDRTDMANAELGRHVVPAPARPEGHSAFFYESTFGARLRTYYFNRDKYDDSYSEAWALGAALAYQSGYLVDLLRVGAVAYTAQPLHAPDSRDGTLLLRSGQKGYTALGQIYGEFKLSEQIFGAIGRKEYNTPYLNSFDTRMTPNTFEGISIYGKASEAHGGPAWRFGGGYISRIKERNANDFVWMSRDADSTVNRGVFIGGGNFEHRGFSIGAINYYSDDIINIFYTEATYMLVVAGNSSFKLAAQFSDQRSTGDDLLTGQAFSTSQWGIKGDFKLGAALFTLAYTDTADEAEMRSPWSGYPGYTSVQVQDFNRANESATLFKASYDFSAHGASGVTAYALWVHGRGRSAPAFNEDEADLNLQWAPTRDVLRGTSFRVRYAHVSQRGGGDPAINDIRLIVNYDF